MNGTLALALWLVWMAGIVGLTVWRFGAVQREKRERKARRAEPADQEKSVATSVGGVDPDEATRVVPLGQEYRQQLIAAGLIKPAVDQLQPEQPV